MPPRSRDGKISRRSWLLAGLGLPVFLRRAWAADNISVSYDGEMLHPVAPNIHFLTGKSLDRLKDAETVTFYWYLSLFDANRNEPRGAAGSKFVVSFDIWEEKFKVAIPGPSMRSKAGLTGPQAEAWCLENMSIRPSGLAQDALFYLRLELRSEHQKGSPTLTADPGGLSISAIIERLSRTAGPDDPHWTLESGRLRLSELIRTQSRGARSG